MLFSCKVRCFCEGFVIKNGKTLEYSTNSPSPSRRGPGRGQGDGPREVSESAFCYMLPGILDSALSP
jgi:hypothetical protein